MAGQWVKLVSKNQVGVATVAFTKAISDSFLVDGARQTQSEIKRRFNLCGMIFESLRGDLKWPVVRALDHIPRYLRCELDREPYNPKAESERVIWTPDTLGDPLR